MVDESIQSNTDPTGSPRHLILGTAGHIDHGKTALVLALTGTDTDRLPEEKRRGMTIELGFAELTIGDTQFGIVDVPGHERFVRTMVAGATAIDVALIVVAADDAVMPQTIEHVEILDLLGVRRAVIAVTKIDTVDADMVELVVEDVRELLSTTSLADAEIVPVSSITGDGIDQLRTAIAAAAGDVAGSSTKAPFRMAIDRVFTIQGRGTVVTGSVLRGRVSSGNTLKLWPGGQSCRVRDLQAYGLNLEHLEGGQRAGVNIIGVDRRSIGRGEELATPGYLQPSHMLDVHLQVLGTHPRGVRSAQTVRLCIGTTEVPVRVVLLNERVLSPGQSGYAQLRSGQPLVATYGQRFIIREENAVRTMGGGVMLRPVGRRRRRSADAECTSLERLKTGDDADRLEEALRPCGFAKPSDLHTCAATGIEVADLPAVYERLIADARWVALPGTSTRCVPAAMHDVENRLVRRLERYHRSQPEEPGRPVDSVIGWLERGTDKTVARAIFDDMLRQKKLKLIGSFVCLPQFAPRLTAADEKILADIVERISAGGFSPPTLDSMIAPPKLDRKRIDRLARLAVAIEQLVRIDGDICLSVESERRLREIVADLINSGGDATVANVREALTSSRKYCVPYLEYLDRIGFTRRVEDRRVLAGESNA